MQDKGDAKLEQILVTSIVSSKDQKPRVDITHTGLNVRYQLSADEAVSHAMDIIQCAQGAYADAFIFHFMMTKIFRSNSAADQSKALAILQDFRLYRETLKKEFDEYKDNT